VDHAVVEFHAWKVQVVQLLQLWPHIRWHYGYVQAFSLKEDARQGNMLEIYAQLQHSDDHAV